jgi:hypothetical protein
LKGLQCSPFRGSFSYFFFLATFLGFAFGMKPPFQWLNIEIFNAVVNSKVADSCRGALDRGRQEFPAIAELHILPGRM